MNKDRAIQLLERMQNPEPYDPQITSEAFDAIQMAIDALSADGDTISKKAVLDALDEIETEVADGYGYQYAKWREYFAEIPSAQPEIIRCNDCKYWNGGSCECREHAVNCQDYMVGDIETEAEYFCGYADRRKVTT